MSKLLTVTLLVFFTCLQINGSVFGEKAHGLIARRAATRGYFVNQVRGLRAGCPDADESLKEHNEFRARHNAPPLKWDNKLAAQAEKWAQHMANIQNMEHSKDDQRPGQGENLAFQWVGLPELEQTVAEDSDKMWMDEEPLYSPSYPYNALHYTQMVWKKTKKFGIGCAKAGDMMYVAARYFPVGNMEGEFENNVQ